MNPAHITKIGNDREMKGKSIGKAEAGGPIDEYGLSEHELLGDTAFGDVEEAFMG